MLIDDIREQQKLRRARVQPHLWFTAFSITEALQEVLRAIFGNWKSRLTYMP